MENNQASFEEVRHKVKKMIELIKEIYEAINHFFDGLKKAINRVHSGIVTGEIKASEIAKVNVQIEPLKGVNRRSAFKNVAVGGNEYGRS